MTTNFLQHNPGAANQESDATYATDTTRTDGIGVDQILPSPWLNKVWFQASTFVAAIANVISGWGGGYTITDTDISVLETNLTNFFSSLSIGATDLIGNGYITLPGGLIIEWGSITSTSTGSFPNGTGTFPLAFPNACFVVVGNANATINNNALNISGNVPICAFSISSKTNFVWRMDSNEGNNFSSGVTLNWIAIGH